MFQCQKDVIVPHQRVTVPKIQPDSTNSDTSSKNLTVAFEVGWRRWEGRPHNSKLDDWTKVKIRVRGSEVSIWIADRLVFREPNLVTFARGRVGFRNFGDEEAHFRKVKVRPLNYNLCGGLIDRLGCWNVIRVYGRVIIPCTEASRQFNCR